MVFNFLRGVKKTPVLKMRKKASTVKQLVSTVKKPKWNNS